MTLLAFSDGSRLLLCTLFAVAVLILLIARFKVHAFIALIIGALFVGLSAGMKLADIAKNFQDGVGAVLGSIAMIVGLGMILGKMLAESGGAEVVANTMVRAFGPKRLDWAMAVIALVIGIPVWFSVGLVLLVPIIFTLAREAKVPLLHVGIPLIAGLSVAHGLVPPHPGPMVAIGLLKADVGKTILWSLIIGAPTTLLCGPLLGKFLTPRVPVAISGIGAQLAQNSERKSLPSFSVALFTMLLPIFLMLLASGADIALDKENAVRQWVDFLGHPVVAMLIGVVVAFWTFGFACGFHRQQIANFVDSCLGPVASLLLVVGAGGGFSRVLIGSGVGDSMTALARSSQLSPLLFGWVVAALIRVATGSATVSISTAAGIMAPIVAHMPEVRLELLVISMGAGSSVLSHLNDGGFWFVKEYFNMTVAQTFKTWTVMVTLKSLVELGLVLVIDQLL
jgi:gluconate:H+ symporter, GntP family